VDCEGNQHNDDIGNGRSQRAVLMSGIPFGVTRWDEVPATEHPGEAGKALWRTRNFGDIRVRLVEYTPGYRADHWCSKGHVLLVLEGTLTTELADGRRFVLTPGSSYQVADGAEPHRSSTETGARLFIVD
jgi:quercetin dioxygenase-like cupin family protein